LDKTTTIYFIRHAEPARRANSHAHGLTDYTYPLTDKGKADTALVTAFLRDKNIDAVLSSPFKRAVDTVAPFAREAGLAVEIVEDFRERRVTYEHVWVEDFRAYGDAQWADFSYKLPDGESLNEVQTRKIAALHEVLRRHEGKTLAVGCHGTALSLVMNHFDPTFGAADFWDMAGKMPWVVKMTFNAAAQCTDMQKIDLFAQRQWTCVCHPYQTFGTYHYAVICARVAVDGAWRWLFARHKERTGWELPGGHIEAGESPLEAARRELFEETGVTDCHLWPAFDFTVHWPDTAATDGNKAGQVFLAEVKAQGALPAHSEMAEVRAFPGLPDALHYPFAHPVLFNEMQAWLAKNTPDELRDLFDAERRPLGTTHRRGDPKPPDAYNVVVRAWVMNAAGQVLITRRALTKLGSPGLWEIPSGSTAAGETSLESAVRELYEETGITVPPGSGTCFLTARHDGAFWDEWLFRAEFDLADVVLQEGETIDARAATLNEIVQMMDDGIFIHHARNEIEVLREKS